MSQIYVLELESGKYYIGETTNLDVRMESHFSGEGSVWTGLHKPVRLVETIKNDTHENKVTLEYMKKYGVDNVRGGSYCNIDLSDQQRESIRNGDCTADDTCYRCGRASHYANECYAEKICYNCGGRGHYTEKCDKYDDSDDDSDSD